MIQPRQHLKRDSWYQLNVEGIHLWCFVFVVIIVLDIIVDKTNPPFQLLMCDNIVLEIKKRGGVYILVYLIDIGDYYFGLPLLVKGLHKYSNNICELFVCLIPSSRLCSVTKLLSGGVPA